MICRCRLVGACSWIVLALFCGLARATPDASAQGGYLPPPFTADQIRDEWVEGLTLVLRTTTLAGESGERWTVVSADADGATIESTPLDSSGGVSGPSRRERSGWEQLRDHAKFPAATATREGVTRETALGTREGWLYIVPDLAQGTVTEFFFARDLPGAPVEMKITQGGETLIEMKQMSRSKPQAKR